LIHGRRRIVHFNVTTNPTVMWAAQQIVETFPADGSEPRYLLRDRDGIYGDYFHRRIKNMGIEQVLIAPRSPWQNPYAERVIGSILRECVNHIIVLSKAHLRRVQKSYVNYYNASRTHYSLDGNAPSPRLIEPPSLGRVVAIPRVGGLHQRYTRAA
jgi:transposase InsO family protein